MRLYHPSQSWVSHSTVTHGSLIHSVMMMLFAHRLLGSPACYLLSPQPFHHTTCLTHLSFLCFIIMRGISCGPIRANQSSPPKLAVQRYYFYQLLSSFPSPTMIFFMQSKVFLIFSSDQFKTTSICFNFTLVTGSQTHSEIILPNNK